MDTHNDNDDSYYGGNPNNEAQQNRYAKLQVYQKVTGKSTFKDYEVLTEAFEKKEMLKVFGFCNNHSNRRNQADIKFVHAVT